ncbi:MAG: ankyrin repeat protein, partial [Chitinophagaceae bacterium]|nr:ankyrin repeat protein [Chitinophagaceae bacterium]
HSVSQKKEKPPALKPELIREFVGAGHGNLAKVKQMLKDEPGLLNGAWDWGGGDFETALEGAGHMGNREIATYLLSEGARGSIFCFAMLGELEIVKALLTAHPTLKDSKGPHGIQLIQHATRGGEQAKEVLTYLQSVGAK